MADNHRINSIDIVRLFAAIMVVAIHTQAITWLSGYSNGNIQILTRVAVPFFFCTSGYFLHKNYINSGCPAVAATFWKTVKLYTLLSLVYFSVIFLSNPALLHESKKWMLVDFLFNGSYYHLWYMVGIIYSIAIIYLICKLKLSKILLPLAIVCYVIGLLGTSYYGIGSRLPILNVPFDSGWFLSIRRIFLMGFPFTALGWVISEGKLKLHIFKNHLLFATALVTLLFIAEIVIVTVTGMSRTIEITVFLYPLLFLLFQICLAYPLEGKSKLASACRDTANFTYFWHPLVILMLRRVVNANFFLFTITTAVCLLLGFGYHYLKNRRRLTYERRSKN
jgi:serine/alanine racemase